MAATIESRLSDSLRDISAFTDVKDIIAIQNQLRAFESDFDKAQSSLRTIASAWILAAIGAMGLVVQNELTGAHRLDGSVAASLRQALFLVASLGLASLWYLDQRVYQRLLHSVFSTGCHLELKTAKILPIRSRAYLLNRDVTHHLGWFYRAPLVLLLAAAVLNIIHAMFGLQAGIDALLSCRAPALAPRANWLLPFVFLALHVLSSVGSSGNRPNGLR